MLEKRMYFFVPYQLTGIQQGIQAGHAALEYARNHSDTEDYKDFIDNWKTWIILNGGTTNGKFIKDPDTGWSVNPRKHPAPYEGTLDNIAHQLVMNDIRYGLFEEPDLNNALTAVCFICDERVFNYEKYPEFHIWVSENMITLTEANDQKYQDEWAETILGNKKNVFLRNLIRNKKLA